MRTSGLLAFVATCMVGTNAQRTISGDITCGQTRTGTTVGGTHTVGQASPENWYSFTASVNGVYQFNTCTGTTYDSYLHVYQRSGTTGVGGLVGSNDDSCGLQSRLSVNIAAGTYWVVVEGFSTRSGTYAVTMTCPSTAVSLASTPLTCSTVATGSTVGATSQNGHAAPEHWFTFTAPITSSYVFSACGSNFDTYLYLRQRPATYTVGAQVTANDDSSACGLQSVLNISSLPAGNYWVVMDGFGSSAGTYRLTVQCLPTQRGVLACGAVRTGSTSTAPAISTVGQPAPDNWWSFRAPFTGVYTFDTCGSLFDTYVYVYTQTGPVVTGPFSTRVVDCDDCGPCGLQSVATAQLTAGNYWVVVDGFGTAAGTYRIATSCPPATIGSIACGQLRTGNTATDGTQTMGSGSPEHWYTFSVSATGYYIFDTCGSAFDTYVRVFNRTGTTVGGQVSFCDDCGPCGLQTVLDTTLPAGDYWLMVEGFSTSQGAYQVRMTCSPLTNAPTPSPTPVNPVVRGAITCASSVTGNTAGRPSAVGNPAPEEWWMFTAPQAGIYTFNTCGSAYDTYVHIFNRTGTSAVTGRGPLVAQCDDCGPCGLRTVMVQELVQGDYWVVVDGFSTRSGAYVLNTTCPTTIIETTATCGTWLTGNTINGTNTVTGTGAARGAENWWPFVAQGYGPYTINTCNSGTQIDTYVHLYERTANNGVGAQIASCDDCGPCGFSTVLENVILTTGNYWIVMDAFGTQQGQYTFQVTCPDPSATNPPTAAPTFQSGAVMSSPLTCGNLVTGSTVGGVNAGGTQPSNDNWYAFTAALSGQYVIDTCGSALDTYVLVYNRLTNDATTLGLGGLVVECDDCGPCGLNSVLVTNLTAGNYWIVVEGFATNNGAYQVTVNCATAPPTSSPTAYGSPTTVAPTTSAPVTRAPTAAGQAGQPTTVAPTTSAPVTMAPYRSEAPTTSPTSSPTAPTLSPIVLQTSAPTASTAAPVPTTTTATTTATAGGPGTSGANTDGGGGGSSFPLLYIIIIAVAAVILIGAIVYAKSGGKKDPQPAADTRNAFSNPIYSEDKAGGASASYADVPPNDGDGYLDVDENPTGEDLYEDGNGDDDF